MSRPRNELNREQEVKVQSGWVMLGLVIAIFVVNIGLIAFRLVQPGPVLAYFIVSMLVAIADRKSVV